jgi:hypothetical protein
MIDPATVNPRAFPAGTGAIDRAAVNEARDSDVAIAFLTA